MISAKNEKNRFLVACAIIVLFVIGNLLNIPFSRELKRLKIAAGNTTVKLSDSIFSDITEVVLVSIALGILIVFIGLWVSSRARLGAPILESYLVKDTKKVKLSAKTIGFSMLYASVAAILLLVLFEFQKEYYPITSKLSRPSKPFYAIVAFSAGITEEILFRLGLMSLIITLIQFLKRKENPSNGILWTGVIIAALFFGLIHLPLSKNFVNLTVFTIGVTMLGNLITGTLFGWIYWKRGLLVAIIAHITFDLVFHVIGSPYA